MGNSRFLWNKRPPPVEGGTAIDHLRLIAKVNIAKAPDNVAAKWLVFLSGMYKPEDDLNDLLALMEDPRFRLRGIALVMLCEYHSKTDALYSYAFKYLRQSAERDGRGGLTYGAVTYAISASLPRILGKDGITSERLREWLPINSFHLQRLALEIIIKRGDKSLSKDVSSLLTTTKSKDLQYECIRALSAITGKKLTPYWEFIAKPEETIKEWGAVLTEPKKD
jgi:hypothetical protein